MIAAEQSYCVQCRYWNAIKQQWSNWCNEKHSLTELQAASYADGITYWHDCCEARVVEEETFGCRKTVDQQTA